MNSINSPVIISAAAIASVFASARAHAQCAAYDTRFHLAGCNSLVQAQAIFDDGTGPALFVSCFNAAGDVHVSLIAKWDGTEWSALAGGVDWQPTPLSARVNALAVFDDGNGDALYVGGQFVSVDGGLPAESLARWDGTSWSALAGQLNSGGYVQSLVTWNDGSGPALFVAGNFSSAGGVTTNDIAKWDGVSWSALAGGNGTANSRVETLALYDDGTGEALYAAGGFSSIGGSAIPYLAKWDGVSWSAVGGGVDQYVIALGVYDDGGGAELYASGFFSNAGGAPAAGIAKWDGTSWSALGSGLAFNSYIEAFEVFDDGAGPVLYGGGNFTSISGVPARYLARWDGASWSALAEQSNTIVYSLRVFDDGSGHGARLFVGGGDHYGTTYHSSPAAWDGVQWADVGAPGAGLPNGAQGEEIFEFDDGGGARILLGTQNSIAGFELRKFDGTAWSTWTNADGMVNLFETHDAGAGAELYVAGSFTSIGGVSANRIAHWTGATWAPLGAGLAGGDQIISDLISFDDGSGSALYVCGRFQTAGGQPAAKVARWDGASWSQVGAGVGGAPGGGGPQTFAVYDAGAGPSLFMAGGFTQTGTTTVNRIARWDGTSWQGIGGLNGPAHELAVFDDGLGAQLYVAGEFGQAGTTAVQNIARWNGTNWSSVGGGIQYGSFAQGVWALTTFDDGSGPALYVAAWNIVGAGGNPLSGLVRWNGSSWSGVGGWTGLGPSSLGAFDDPLGIGPSLFFATSQILVAGTPSHHFGRWGSTCPCVTSYCTAGTSTNGCAATLSAVGSPSASAATSFVVTANDVEGQKLGLVFYGLSGATAAPWGTTSSTLCVKPPQQRATQMSSSGTPGLCNGTLALDWNAYVASHPNALGAPFSAGTTLSLQAWYRDPPSGKTTALSDALAALMCP